jgi:hypothetical protein
MRDAGIYVKMTAEEVKQARARAKQECVTLSELVRSLLLGPPPPEEEEESPAPAAVSQRCVCGDLASKHRAGKCTVCKCARLVLS